MKRPLFASWAVALGVACGVSALAPALAQERGGNDRGQTNSERTSNRDRDRDEDRDRDGASERINRALQSYESYREKAGPNVEQTRKEIDRLRDELEELTKLRTDMAVSLAEIRADMASHQFMAGPAMQPGGPQGGAPGFAGQHVLYAGAPQGSAARFTEPSREERQRLRREALNHELRQVQEQLRMEVDQAQGHADQLVAQIRDMRSQERQMREQMRAAQERQHEQERNRDSSSSPNRKENEGDHKSSGENARQGQPTQPQ